MVDNKIFTKIAQHRNWYEYNNNRNFWSLTRWAYRIV
jgi:hypothetical protein